MLIVMSHNASSDDVERVITSIEEMGYEARPIPGKQRTAIGLIGNDGKVDSGRLEALPGVLQVIHVSQPYKQVSREWKTENTIIELANGTRIGSNEIVLMAGPCSVESETQIIGVGHLVCKGGRKGVHAGGQDVDRAHFNSMCS